MFYYIKGKYISSFGNFVVVDVSGVGYKINTSHNTIKTMPHTGSEVLIYTHTYVREDIFEIYGFLTLDEQNLFELLISVSGVGPKAAIAILSALSPSQFSLAIVTGDAKSITKAQGVGPKLAQRIILDLKDKLKKMEIEGMDDISISDTENDQNEAVMALVALGYSANDAQNAVSKVKSDNIEETIKNALKLLMKR